MIATFRPYMSITNSTVVSLSPSTSQSQSQSISQDPLIPPDTIINVTTGNEKPVKKNWLQRNLSPNIEVNLGPTLNKLEAPIKSFLENAKKTMDNSAQKAEAFMDDTTKDLKDFRKKIEETLVATQHASSIYTVGYICEIVISLVTTVIALWKCTDTTVRGCIVATFLTSHHLVTSLSAASLAGVLGVFKIDKPEDKPIAQAKIVSEATVDEHENFFIMFCKLVAHSLGFGDVDVKLDERRAKRLGSIGSAVNGFGHIIEYTRKCIKWMYESIYEWFYGFPPGIVENEQVQQMIKAVIDKANEIRLIVDRSKLYADAKYYHELSHVIANIEAIDSIFIKDKMKINLTSYHTAKKEILAEFTCCRARFVGAGQRNQPVAIAFVGPPGRGKSQACKIMAKSLVAGALGIDPRKDKNIMFCASKDLFMDGYEQQPVYFGDEKFQGDSTELRREEGKALIELINNAPMHCPMAALEKKKNVYFNSPFVLCTSNRIDWTAKGSGLQDPIALVRRFDFYIYLDSKVDLTKAKTIRTDAWICRLAPSKWFLSVDHDPMKWPIVPFEEIINRAIDLHFQRASPEMDLESYSEDFALKFLDSHHGRSNLINKQNRVNDTQTPEQTEIEAYAKQIAEEKIEEQLMKHQRFLEKNAELKVQADLVAKELKLDDSIQNKDEDDKYLPPIIKPSAPFIAQVKPEFQGWFDWFRPKPFDMTQEEYAAVIQHAILEKNAAYVDAMQTKQLRDRANAITKEEIEAAGMITHDMEVNTKRAAEMVEALRKDPTLAYPSLIIPGLVSLGSAIALFGLLFAGYKLFNWLTEANAQGNYDVTLKPGKKIANVAPPAGKMTSAPIAQSGKQTVDIGAKIAANIGKIFLYDDKTECYSQNVLWYFGKTCAVNRHCLLFLNKIKQLTCEVTVGTTRYPVDISKAEYCGHDGFDYIFLHVTDLPIQVPDIRKYQVKTPEDLENARTSSVFIIEKPNPETGVPLCISSEHNEILENLVYTLDGHSLETTNILLIRGKDLSMVRGNCGLPYISGTNNTGARRLIGIHVAGGHRTAYCQIIFQDDLYAIPWAPIAQGKFTPPPGIQAERVEPHNAVRLPSKTSITKTLIFDKVRPHTREPAVLAPVMRDGISVSPIEKALVKLTKPDPVFPDSTKRLLKICMSRVWETKISTVDCHPLSIVDAINRPVGYNVVSPVYLNTSCGYGEHAWSIHHKKGKQDFITMHESGFRYPTPLLGDAVEDLFDRLLKDDWETNTKFIAQDCLKDELRPLEKVKDVKTRLFSACPVDWLVALRMLFLWVAEDCINSHNEGPHALGINPNSPEWKFMKDYLCPEPEMQNHIIPGDISNQDGSHSSFIGKCWTEEAISFAQLHTSMKGGQWMILSGRTYTDAQIAILRYRMMHQVIVSGCWHICGDILFKISGGKNPSGFPFTTQYNSDCTECCKLFCGYSWRKRVEIENPTKYPECATVKTVDEAMRSKGQGDDHLFALRKLMQDFGMGAMCHYMKEINYEYTDFKKGKIEYDPVTLQCTNCPDQYKLSEVRFLRRGFLDYEDLTLAPLEEDLLYDMLNWCSDSTTPQAGTLLSAKSAIFEAGNYGKEFYDKFQSEVNYALINVGLRPIDIPFSAWMANRIQMSSTYKWPSDLYTLDKLTFQEEIPDAQGNWTGQSQIPSGDLPPLIVQESEVEPTVDFGPQHEEIPVEPVPAPIPEAVLAITDPIQRAVAYAFGCMKRRAKTLSEIHTDPIYSSFISMTHAQEALNFLHGMHFINLAEWRNAQMLWSLVSYRNAQATVPGIPQVVVPDWLEDLYLPNSLLALVPLVDFYDDEDPLYLAWYPQEDDEGWFYQDETFIPPTHTPENWEDAYTVETVDQEEIPDAQGRSVFQSEDDRIKHALEVLKILAQADFSTPHIPTNIVIQPLPHRPQRVRRSTRVTPAPMPEAQMDAKIDVSPSPSPSSGIVSITREQEKKSEVGTFGKIFEGVKKIMPFLKTARIVGGLVSTVVKARISPLGSFFGLGDMPNTLQMPHRVILDEDSSMCIVKGQDNVSPLMLDPRNMVSNDHKFFCESYGPMEYFENYKMLPALVVDNVFDGSFANNVVLIQIPVAPTYCPSTAIDQYVVTPLSNMTSLFRYWSGSLKFYFKFKTSKFVSTRVRFEWYPDQSAIASMTDSTSGDIISMTIDINGPTECKFTIPYLREKHKLTVLPPHLIASVTPSDYVDNVNGILVMRVIVPPVVYSTTAGSSVDWQCWMSGGEDFQVDRPTGRWSNYEFDVAPPLSKSGLKYKRNLKQNEIPEAQGSTTGDSPTMQAQFREVFPSLIQADFTTKENILGGENVSSWTELFHRYTYVQTSNTGSPGVKFSYAVNPWLPEFLPEPSQWDQLLFSFMFYRGNTRMKTIFADAVADTLVTMTNWVTDASNQVEDFDLFPDRAGMNYINHRTRGNIEGEIPYYGSFPMFSCQNTNEMFEQPGFRVDAFDFATNSHKFYNLLATGDNFTCGVHTAPGYWIYTAPGKKAYKKKQKKSKLPEAQGRYAACRTSQPTNSGWGEACIDGRFVVARQQSENPYLPATKMRWLLHAKHQFKGTNVQVKSVYYCEITKSWYAHTKIVKPEAQMNTQTGRGNEDRLPVETTAQEEIQLSSFRDTVAVNAESNNQISSIHRGTDPYNDTSLMEPLSRSYVIKRFTMLGTQPVGAKIAQLNFPHDLLQIITIQEKLNHFKYFRSPVRVEVRLNSTGFHSGEVLMVYCPHWNPNNTSGLMKTDDVYSLSALPCVPIDVTSNVTTSVTIPYVAPSAWFDLTTDSSDLSPNAGFFGFFKFFVTAPLRLVSDTATPSLEFIVNANFTRPEVSGYTLKPLFSTSATARKSANSLNKNSKSEESESSDDD